MPFNIQIHEAQSLPLLLYNGPAILHMYIKITRYDISLRFSNVWTICDSEWFCGEQARITGQFPSIKGHTCLAVW